MIKFFVLISFITLLISGESLVSKKIAIVGASGELGRVLTKQSIDLGYTVTAIVRDINKLKSIFSEESMSKITAIEADVGLRTHDNSRAFQQAFEGQDLIIETLSNSQRPDGPQFLIDAAERAGVEAFMVCGGAGILFESNREDAKRVYTTLAPSMSWLVEVSVGHLEVQKLAFVSRIPIVTQFCPARMIHGALTGKALPTKDLSLAVWEMTYEDVASTILGVIPKIEEYNRHMIGFRMVKRVMTVMSDNGKVLHTRELEDRKARKREREL